MQYHTNYPYATTSLQHGGSQTREEQRRRQQEYSQALAQQVAQREEQKRREREMDRQYARRNSNIQHPPQQTHQDPPQPPVGGILGGLGHNNPQHSRTSFARGQQQPHHHLPGPEPNDYSQPNGFQPRQVSYAGQAIQQPQQPPVDNQTFQGGFGFPFGPNQYQQHQPMQQQNWQQQTAHRDPRFVSGPGNMQTGWSQQNPQQRPMPQMRNSQFWQGQDAEQAPPPVVYDNYGSSQSFPRNNMKSQTEPPGHAAIQNRGQLQQPDIHFGRRDNFEDNEKRRKLQQQQEMQQALERQIEEKRLQKLEAKRQQEEEDRREAEHFEVEQRRLRAEKDRLQEEKRRKAELEQQKAVQAAAAVAAANQQAKLEQQQKLHAQLQHSQYPPSAQQQQQQQLPEHFVTAPAPSSLKNTFTNPRAHLFDDPPQPEAPQRGPMPPNNQFGFSNQKVSPVRTAQQSFGYAFQQANNAVGPSVDPVELRRQYDDMREELRRQKQLVDQLRQAQTQIQQRSPDRAEGENGPTLMDLEKLRNELRGELEYRERLHQQELASLKREQQHRSPEHSPRHYPGMKNSLELPVDSAPSDIHHIPHHRFASHERNNLYEPQISHVRNKHLKHLDEAPINESLKSLRGESTFVYFDDRIVKDKKKMLSGEDVVDEQEGGLSDERSESSQIRRFTQKNLPTKAPVKLSVGTTDSSSLSRKNENQEDIDTDSEDDDHEFVVARSVSFQPHSDRYSQLPTALSSSSPTKNYVKWRLESMNTNDINDSDDDLDVSLDGEQLEALFQRNLRRHEILLGFQNKVHHDSTQPKADGTPHSRMAWAELHQQLERNKRTPKFAQHQNFSTNSSNDSNHQQMIDQDDEDALVASSRWMPASLLTQEQETRRTSAVNK
ncbi:hypothetical protein PHMEG_0005482 [Phytophthora megakarya]|uniref:Uncharacterized protein n=1 Tax=Phytophthora megakarya TaxID=4795 RepID=A0A225WRF4_9STRA|nr:hypothetical protein PHMEG_0005482 [Phytophthora megakarya]